MNNLIMKNTFFIYISVKITEKSTNTGTGSDTGQIRVRYAFSWVRYGSDTGQIRGGAFLCCCSGAFSTKNYFSDPIIFFTFVLFLHPFPHFYPTE